MMPCSSLDQAFFNRFDPASDRPLLSPGSAVIDLHPDDLRRKLLDLDRSRYFPPAGRTRLHASAARRVHRPRHSDRSRSARARNSRPALFRSVLYPGSAARQFFHCTVSKLSRNVLPLITASLGGLLQCQGRHTGGRLSRRRGTDHGDLQLFPGHFVAFFGPEWPPQPA